MASGGPIEVLRGEHNRILELVQTLARGDVGADRVSVVDTAQEVILALQRAEAAADSAAKKLSDSEEMIFELKEENVFVHQRVEELVRVRQANSAGTSGFASPRLSLASGEELSAGYPKPPIDRTSAPPTPVGARASRRSSISSKMDFPNLEMLHPGLLREASGGGVGGGHAGRRPSIESMRSNPLSRRDSLEPWDSKCLDDKTKDQIERARAALVSFPSQTLSDLSSNHEGREADEGDGSFAILTKSMGSLDSLHSPTLEQRPLRLPLVSHILESGMSISSSRGGLLSPYPTSDSLKEADRDGSFGKREDAGRDGEVTLSKIEKARAALVSSRSTLSLRSNGLDVDKRVVTPDKLKQAFAASFSGMLDGGDVDHALKLWVMRAGEAENPETARRQYDPPLSIKGRSAAYQVGASLAEEAGGGFQYVVCAPSLKCMQTALQVIKAYESRMQLELLSSHKIIVDPGLAQHPSKMSSFTPESYLTYDEAIEFEVDLADRLFDYEAPEMVPRDETQEQARLRFDDAITRAISRGSQLIVAHADFLTRMLERLSISENHDLVQKLPHCSHIKCELPSKRDRENDQGFKLISLKKIQFNSEQEQGPISPTSQDHSAVPLYQPHSLRRNTNNSAGLDSLDEHSPDGSAHALHYLRGDGRRDSSQMRRQSDSGWGMPSHEVLDRYDKRNKEVFEGFVSAPFRKQHSETSVGRKSSLHGDELPPAHRKHGAEMRRSSVSLPFSPKREEQGTLSPWDLPSASDSGGFRSNAASPEHGFHKAGNPSGASRSRRSSLMGDSENIIKMLNMKRGSITPEESTTPSGGITPRGTFSGPLPWRQGELTEL